MEIGKFFHSNYVMGTENMEILKVVIADDEVRICQLIQALIDWDSLGMKVVGIAHNGEDACEMVQQTQPDILITDIRMPGCSGLELVKRVKELDSALEVIIISGYAHFEYAQQAISYGVGHYLLKPVNKGELTATLQKLQKKIGERKESELNHQELVNKAKRDDDHLRANLIDRLLDQPDMPVEPVVEVLNELKEAGKIKRFGGSNWTVERVKELNEYAAKHQMEGFTAVSPCFNMMDHAEDPWGGSVCINGEQGEEARKYYRENQIPVFAYSSLARGFLSGRYRTDGRKRMEECIMQAAIQEYNSPENIEKLRKAEILAQKKSCGVSEIALAWLLHQKEEVFPIVSPSTREHMKENAKAFSVKLTEDELKWMAII